MESGGKSPKKTVSELRQDLVSGEWIIYAPNRLKRPGDLLKKTVQREKTSKVSCPFEEPQKSGHGKAVLVFPGFYPVKNPRLVGRQVARANAPKGGPMGRVVSNGVKNWELQVIPNKFPALVPQKTKAATLKHGAYDIFPGVGHHELLITRAHDKNFSELSGVKAFNVFQAFRDRYLMLMNDKNIAYVSIFQNWGLAAGASQPHPHYQIIAIPVVPPDVERSLLGSKKFFGKRRTCVHCAIINQEKREKRRIIFENSGAVAFVPFASPNPFEIAVFPKKHLPFFENTFDGDLEAVAEALRFSLHSVKKNLKDPDYNFFIHTSPVREKRKHKYYHWHIEVLPKFSTMGGFEFGTGAMINVVDPDKAARILKGQKAGDV